MLGVGKSDENSLVHCCFVVTPSLKAVQVTTITWYLSFTLLNSIKLLLPADEKG